MQLVIDYSLFIMLSRWGFKFSSKALLNHFVQSDMVAKVEAKASVLRHMDEHLCKKVEGLQMNCFSGVEGLVYLHWVNSCLRYELRNSDTTTGKMSSVDLKDSLSPKS